MHGVSRGKIQRYYQRMTYRHGKGQTYIEPFIDVYTRCRVKWNLIFTDPKGGAPRSVLKRYSTALMRWRTNNVLLGMMG